jgi:N-acetylmuramoyl-L-alanine amidase CwlA
MTPEFIVIHNTYNDASANNEVSYMQRNSNSTSFHIAVDNFEAVQGLPLDRNAWHAGDGNGSGNRKGISIEICYSKSGGARFEAAQDNAAQLTAKMLKERNWDITKVKKHQDFSGKHCPHRTLDDYGWDYFLNLVSKYLGENSKGGETNMRYFKIVDPTGMNMRTAPNKTKVQSIPTGAVISGTEFKTDNGVQWVYTTYNGKSGYVAVLPESKGYAKEVTNEYNKPAPAPAPTPAPAPAENWEEKYNTVTKQFNELQAKFNELSTAYDNAKKANEELTKENNELKNSITTIQTEKTNLEANIVDIQNQLGNANEKIQSFKIAWENLMK